MLKGLKSQAKGRECRAQGFGLRVSSRGSNFFTESAMTECDHMSYSEKLLVSPLMTPIVVPI